MQGVYTSYAGIHLPNNNGMTVIERRFTGTPD